MVSHQETEKGLICQELKDLAQIANQLIQLAGSERVWLFEGDLGAGKTTVIKTICQLLGVTDVVSSPTYSLINEYVYDDQNLVYHFDFYRIDHLREAIDIGVEDYFYSGAYCFIEWGSKIQPLLPDSYFEIDIEVRPDGAREFLTAKHE